MEKGKSLIFFMNLGDSFLGFPPAVGGGGM